MGRSVHIEDYRSYAESVPRALAAIGATNVLARQHRILIKPNLVNGSPPPVTLPAAAVDALVVAIQGEARAELVVGEGTGDAQRATTEVFSIHGYDRLASRHGISLVDLNEAPLVRLESPDCQVFPFLMLPRLVRDSFIVSFAVLKAHSLAAVTLTMKNMMGCAPPAYYQGGAAWKKAAFHARMHQSIFELNRYRKPDLALIDASIGLAEHHLGGPTCVPPVRKIVAGFDPVAVDAAGAGLLGQDWRGVPHIRLADGVLGRAGPPPEQRGSPAPSTHCR